MKFKNFFKKEKQEGIAVVYSYPETKGDDILTYTTLTTEKATDKALNDSSLLVASVHGPALLEEKIYKIEDIASFDKMNFDKLSSYLDKIAPISKKQLSDKIIDIAFSQSASFTQDQYASSDQVMKLIGHHVLSNSGSFEKLNDFYKTTEFWDKQIIEYVNGDLLKYVPENLKTYELCLGACTTPNTGCLKYIPLNFSSEEITKLISYNVDEAGENNYMSTISALRNLPSEYWEKPNIPELFNKIMERTPAFFAKALVEDSKIFSLLPDSLKTYKISYSACIDNTDNIRHLPLRFTFSEIKKIVSDSIPGRSSDLIYKQESIYPAEIVKNIQKLPPEYVENGITSLFNKELESYVKIFNNKQNSIETTPEQAYEAMSFFAKNRFVRALEEYGAENAYTQMVPCEHEIFKDMKNPAECFMPELLTPQQWHEIAKINTNMMNHIPQTIINNNEFWNDYESLIGRGTYPKHPSNEYKLFDEKEVFAKMPETLKSDPAIYDILLNKNVVTLSDILTIVPNTEDLYLKYGHKNYDIIPYSLKEQDNFKEVAHKAVMTDPYNYNNLPEKFRTMEMAEKAVSSDIMISQYLNVKLFSSDSLERLLPAILPRIEEIKEQDYKNNEYPPIIDSDYSERKKYLKEFLTNLSPEQISPVVKNQIDSIFSQLGERKAEQTQNYKLCI